MKNAGNKRKTFPKKDEGRPGPTTTNRFQRKVNYDKIQKEKDLERNDRKFGKFGYKNESAVNIMKNSNKKQGTKTIAIDRRKKGGKMKKQRNEPAKNTSLEYSQLATSDDNESVADVSDMMEVPLMNSADADKKKVINTVKKTFTVNDLKEEVKTEESHEDSEESNAEEDDIEEKEMLKFREELSSMPLGKVRELKEKLGINLFNKAYFGISEVEKQKKKKKSVEVEKNEKRGQHRPKEISSKRPVSAFRNIYKDHEQPAKKRKWDPRFDNRAGEFKEVCFENNYSFLDDIRQSEMNDLKKELRKAKMGDDEKYANKLKQTIQKMENEDRTRAEKLRKSEVRRQLHQENIDRMMRGEAPVFKTKGQVRRMEMEKKYEQLKSENKLDKYMQRKAKKEAAKEKKSKALIE